MCSPDFVQHIWTSRPQTANQMEGSQPVSQSVRTCLGLLVNPKIQNPPEGNREIGEGLAMTKAKDDRLIPWMSSDGTGEMRHPSSASFCCPHLQSSPRNAAIAWPIPKRQKTGGLIPVYSVPDSKQILCGWHDTAAMWRV